MRWLVLVLLSLCGCASPEYRVLIDPAFSQDERLAIIEAGVAWSEAAAFYYEVGAPVYEYGTIAVFRAEPPPGKAGHTDVYDHTVFGKKAKIRTLSPTRSLMVHELGHALGLDHSEDPTSAMHDPSLVESPSEADVAAVTRR